MESHDGADLSGPDAGIERAWRDGLKPDPLLTVSQWADRYRVLSQRASSEPGRWRTERTPYLKEIMDCLSPSSPFQRVVFMKGSQVGGSECGNNWIAYVIHQAPGPMMAVAPTVELAKRNSKQRLDPLIEESEVLRERVKERRSRDSGNTVLCKEFPGGVLILTGANSAVGLRSMPARYLFLDEVDGYPGDVEGEGDPILLAERRSATFQRRKILLVSTPKTKGLSRIEREYGQSDQRRYFVPCPHCDEHQTLELQNLRWPEGRPREAEYACTHCGSLIGERHKTWMLEHGEWRPTAEGDGRTAGFHLSSLYSPVGWFSWADAAEMYEQARKAPGPDEGLRQHGAGAAVRGGGRGAGVAAAVRAARDLPYRHRARAGSVPDRWCRRPEGPARGRGRRLGPGQGELVGRLPGDRGRHRRAEVWAKLDALLARDWPHASGHTLPIRVMCVDAGYATQDVYAWVRQHPQGSWGPAGAAARQPRTVVAVKGRDRDTALLLSVSKADAGGRRRGLRVWSVGTPVAKGELYRWLKLEWPTEEALEIGASYPPGACHFPQYGEEYFKQLTAERLVTRIVKGFPRASWEKEPGRRNEALDCRVYARAAAAIYGLDRFDERHWRRMEEALARTAERDDDEPASHRSSSMRPPARQVIHSGYMAR